VVGLGPDGYVVLAGAGDGSFTAGTPVPLGMGRQFQDIVAGDFDGDGKTDIAGIFSQPAQPLQIGTLFGRGNGTFDPLVPASLGTLGGATLAHLHAGDFNGDGRTDLALVAPAAATAAVLLSDAAGGYVRSSDPDLVGAGRETLGLHDVDGDGDLDLVFGESTGPSVRVYFNDRL
jgi:hypothetical protein